MRELFHQELVKLTRRAHLAIELARKASSGEHRAATVIDLLRAFHELPAQEDSILAQRNMPPIDGVRGGMALRILQAVGATAEVLATCAASESPAIVWDEVIGRSLQHANSRGRFYIATEHLLLGLLDTYADSLTSLGIQREMVAQAAADLIDQPLRPQV